MRDRSMAFANAYIEADLPAGPVTGSLSVGLDALALSARGAISAATMPNLLMKSDKDNTFWTPNG